MRRIIYLGYYLKKLDWSSYFAFLNQASKEGGSMRLILVLDSFYSVFKYNISLLEYFQFRFYKQGAEERATWAGTGTMYEYQRIMNPPASRGILDDKLKFHEAYKSLMRHAAASAEELAKGSLELSSLSAGKDGLIVVKEVSGKCGKGVDFVPANQFEGARDLAKWMQAEGFDMAERFIVQAPEMQVLSPTAVNTVRIFTQLNDEGKVEILGCRLRISVNSKVDNLAAGNLAAELDEKTGIVIRPAVYSDIRKPNEMRHPITGVAILGFQVPFWQETLNLVKQAALLHPQNRSIGWDIAISAEGPVLIEGNHDWCKLLWQLPAGKGLKNELKKYLEI
ncbi:hypothetical protein MASR2M44_14350 [Bacteroidota bacterium]